MEKYTEIIFILDRSGSMAGLEMDTIGGYNATIEKQKAQQGQAVVSTILFNHYSKVICNCCIIIAVEVGNSLRAYSHAVKHIV